MQPTLSDIMKHHAALGAPEDQQQLIALLKEAQQCCGGVLEQETIRLIAAEMQIREPLLRVLIRRIPSLRLAEAPHRLELCGNCAASRQLLSHIQKRYGVTEGGISERGGFSCHVTGCMKNCRSGPSIRWDGVLYSRADAALIDQLIGKP